MAEQKILAIFSSADTMKQALDSLNQFGFTHDVISVLMHRSEPAQSTMFSNGRSTEDQDALRTYSAAAPPALRPENRLQDPELETPPIAFSPSPPFVQALAVEVQPPVHETAWTVRAKSQSDLSAGSAPEVPADSPLEPEFDRQASNAESELAAELADNDFAIKDPDALLKDAIRGAGLGLIAGAVALLIPGVGPVIAAGPLAAAIAAMATGAAVGTTAGALVGLFQDEGIPGDLIDAYYKAFEAGKGIMILKPQNINDYNLMLNIIKRQHPESLDLVA